MHLNLMATDWNPEKYRPSKHRNGKRTKGKKRFEAKSKGEQAMRRREAQKKEGRYRD